MQAAALDSQRSGTRVIGWYHSHPHITVLPSHVDVRTQHHWQQMVTPRAVCADVVLTLKQDPNFVGLIFACFGKAQQQVILNRCIWWTFTWHIEQTVVRNQVIAFQAADTQDPSSSRRSVVRSGCIALHQRHRLHPTVIREAMASGQRCGSCYFIETETDSVAVLAGSLCPYQSCPCASVELAVMCSLVN